MVQIYKPLLEVYSRLYFETSITNIKEVREFDIHDLLSRKVQSYDLVIVLKKDGTIVDLPVGSYVDLSYTSEEELNRAGETIRSSLHSLGINLDELGFLVCVKEVQAQNYVLT